MMEFEPTTSSVFECGLLLCYNLCALRKHFCMITVLPMNVKILLSLVTNTKLADFFVLSKYHFI